MKKTAALFFLFFIPLAVLYFPTRNAGFVTDFVGWQMAFDNQTFLQTLDGKGHNIGSFYQFTHVLMYIMSALFGKHGLPWYLVQCAFVALDGVLIYHLFKKISTLFGFNDASIIALIGIAFWLASPYLAEVMVWRAAFHYPLAFAMQTAYVLCALTFMETQNRRYIYGANGLFFLSLFSLEYFFVTPFLILAMLILSVLNDTKQFKENRKTYLTATIAFFLTPLVGLGFYVLAFHASFGKWVSHDRQSDAPFLLFNLDSYGTYAKYVVKHLGFVRHWDSPQKETVFNFFSNHSNQIVVMLCVLTVSLVGLAFFNRLKGFGKTLFWSFAMFSLWLIPAVSLFFSTMLLTENDRYAFIPSLFLMLIFALFLSRLPRFVFYGLSLIYLGCSLYLTIKTNRIWQKTGVVYWSLINNYKWQDAEAEVILLNVPDCMKGMYLFKGYEYNSAFTPAIDVYRRTNLSKNTTEAMRYNMIDLQSGATVVMDAPDTVRVVLKQPGSWWMMKDWSAKTYETDSFKALVREWDYQLILKPSARKRILLYQKGLEWKVVDTTKIGVEQE